MPSYDRALDLCTLVILMELHTAVQGVGVDAHILQCEWLSRMVRTWCQAADNSALDNVVPDLNDGIRVSESCTRRACHLHCVGHARDAVGQLLEQHNLQHQF